MENSPCGPSSGFWRRVAGGLNESAQQQLHAVLEPHLARRVPVGLPPPTTKLKGIVPEALEEMVRCAASLELLPVGKKAELEPGSRHGWAARDGGWSVGVGARSTWSPRSRSRSSAQGRERRDGRGVGCAAVVARSEEARHGLVRARVAGSADR